MENVIKIKKGLDIPIQGIADGSLRAPTLIFEEYAVKPTDFYGLRPKLMVKEGERVLAGTPLFFDKHDERIQITSPVSGQIQKIVYGEKRRIEEVRIHADQEVEYVNFPLCPLADLNTEKVKELLLASGLWAMIRQRPFDIIANPSHTPKAIFISGFDTAPLAADYDVMVHGRGEFFQAGIEAVRFLTKGKIHLNLHAKRTSSEVFIRSKHVEIHYFEGPHPSGNISVQVQQLEPINKGEEIWYIHPQDIIAIGHLFMDGKYDATKIVALAGSEVKRTGYHRILSGVNVGYLLADNLITDNSRIISGNVLTGTNIGTSGYLGFYDHLISVVPEGNRYRFMGWLTLGLHRYSFSHSFFSWLFPHKQYKMDTNLNGGQRAFVMTGEFEKVFPMDIYPLQLIKACITKDIDAMEQLGIYEVVPEDFALCEYIDISKTDIQQIIREGIDLIREETEG
ncbi:MAG: Na(+)-translocating NADH-quinone reductase subunit A [Bacteroidales bacterium]